MYGIIANLKVYFVDDSEENRVSTTVVGRIEKHFEQKMESLTTKDFLTNIQRVLQQAGMRRVIRMNRNDRYVYNPDQPREVDWSNAFEVAQKEGASSKGRDEWWILVSGWNQQFKFRQDVMFKEKHALSVPPMVIEIRALPAAWAQLPGEDFGVWMQRLELALRDKEGVKTEEVRLRPQIEKYLQDYEKLLKDSFPTRDFSQSLTINLSGIDLKSFGENYSTEQTS